jgi:uncharacterized protein YhaN
MRILSLWLDGYGRFSGRELTLGPGFQVVFGPNEQGKSTVRSFIGHMLYGQKRSTTQRLYEEDHDLRRPWASPDRYEGRMLYRLDNGHEIEVRRVFERASESVTVFDRTLARDVTGTFERLRNHDPAFAEAHLGLSKAVFLNTATISPLTLDKLGDTDALAQIREKLLSLADTTEASHTAETALAWIEQRVVAIGRSNAPTKPLPAARRRLDELDREHAAVMRLHTELNELDRQRLAGEETLRGLRARQAELDAERTALARVERVRRLGHAEEVQRELDACTQRCFSLGGLRDFPLGQEADLQRLLNVITTSRHQLGRSEEERRELAEQVRQERERLGPLADQTPDPVPEDQEQRLEELEEAIAARIERLDQEEHAAAAARERLDTAQADLEELPDFTLRTGDPIGWLSGLRGGFESSRAERDREQREFHEAEAAVRGLEAALALPVRVFARFADFPAALSEYKVTLAMHRERHAELTAESERWAAAAAEHAALVAPRRNWGLLGAAGTAALAATGWYTGNWSVYIPAGVVALVSAWCLASALLNRSAAARARAQEARVRNAVALADEDSRRRRAPVDEAVAAAGYRSVREIEALHDRYVQDRRLLDEARFSLDARRRAAAKATERFAACRDEVFGAFADIGVEVEGEGQIEEAVARALARYQEFRDAKRRVGENKGVPEQHLERADSLRTELDALRAEERTLALALRERMREAGFRDESRHTSILKAIRAYNARCSEVREKRSRVVLLQEKLSGLEQRVAAERKELTASEEALNRFLRDVGADSEAAWRAMADKAREYRQVRGQRAALEEKLDTLLRGESIEALRASVEGTEPGLGEPRPEAAIRAEMAEVARAIGETAEKVHALEIEHTQRAAGARPFNEIEEERAAVAGCLADLEMEFEAAAHAAAVIEEMARDSHARIAPRLAATASGWLGEITGGAYNELLVSRDLRVSVRIPQTRELNANPERRLSTGTVDQIYLALRLAFVTCMGSNGEGIPMILDDPFGNYDDQRLERTMRLLAQLGDEHQILLFSCHDEVAQTARALGAPVILL